LCDKQPPTKEANLELLEVGEKDSIVDAQVLGNSVGFRCDTFNLNKEEGA
jgi:hypothetical protein